MDSATAPGITETHNVVELPLVRATPETLAGFGRLVDDYAGTEIDIVTWPAPGWRPVDPGTGNEGGVSEGLFEFWWAGDVLRARNQAVSDHYVTGWTCDPSKASEDTATAPRTSWPIR